MIPVLSRLFVLWGGMSRHPSVWKAEPLFESRISWSLRSGMGVSGIPICPAITQVLQ